jgi:hypothetical protein
MGKIESIVYGYNTKYEEGFIKEEIEDILQLFPNIDMEKFDKALQGNTCMTRDNQTIIFHCDIEKAIRCGVEGRDLNWWEWD